MLAKGQPFMHFPEHALYVAENFHKVSNFAFYMVDRLTTKIKPTN